MDYSDYQQLKTAWDSIERLEHLESLANSGKHLSFMAEFAPSCASVVRSNKSCAFALTPDMNRIVMKALMSYKEDLKARMAAIEFKDTTAMPIVD